MKFAIFALVFASILPAQVVASPADPSAELVSQGRITIQVEDAQAALPLFERATKLDAKNAQAWFELGMCQGRLGQQSAKVASLERAIEVLPSYTAARHQLVLSLRILGRTKDLQAQLVELKKYDAALATGVERNLAAPTQVASR